MGRFNQNVKTNFTYMTSDFCAGILATMLAGIISGYNIFTTHRYYLVLCISFNLICIFINKGLNLYNITLFFYLDRVLKYIMRSFIFTTAIVSTLLFYVARADVDRKFYIAFLGFEYILLMLSAYLERKIRKKYQKLSPRTIILGSINRYDKFLYYVKKSNLNVNLIGFVSLGEEEEGYIGKIDDLEIIIHEKAIDYIYIIDSRSNEIDFNSYINMCINMGITVGIIVDFYSDIYAHSYISSIGTYPLVTYHTVVLNSVTKAVKRIMDIVGSIVGIILFSPFMLGAAIAIKLENKSVSIIFKQIRVGQNGRHFYMYKFRSMCPDAEAKKIDLMAMNEISGDCMFKIKDDPRITKVGRILRKTNMDELPQFFNVLIGNMSLVGTRPPTLDEVEKYKRNHWRRVSIKPGITGMWQVSGRSKIINFDEIVELDTIYIDSYSILLDIKIILKTIVKMIFRHKDAY